MKIKSVEFTNYRRFKNIKIDLDPELTVITGKNNCGKTTVLDGIYSTLDDQRKFKESDVCFEINGDISSISTYSDFYENVYPTFCLCYIGDTPFKKYELNYFGRIELERLWFLCKEYKEHNYNVSPISHFDILLKPFLSKLKIDDSYKFIVEDNKGSQSDLRYIGDGMWRLIAIIGDIIDRVYVFNYFENVDDPSKTIHGTVLIDNIESHLYPEIQYSIINSLRTIFPKIQFIITTCSPFILSTIEKKHIRILPEDLDDCVRIPETEVIGCSVESSMLDILCIPATPETKYYDMINDYIAEIESENGLRLREQLVDFYGEFHQVILDADKLIRFMEFKN
jgi:predicted ATP-binding protein involved in virulence